MSLLLHEMNVFCEACSCLMITRSCLVKISCFKPVFVTADHDLVAGLPLTPKKVYHLMKLMMSQEAHKFHQPNFCLTN